MKKDLLFYFLLSPFTLFAQNGNISLEWKEQNTYIGNRNIEYPSVINAITYFDSAIGLPIATTTIDESKEIIAHTLKTNNLKTKRLHKKYKDLNNYSIPTKFEVSLNTGTSEKGRINQLNYIPFIKIGTEIHQVLSFDFQYQTQNHSAFNTVNWPTQSVLATGSWHKIKINDTGIYRLDKKALVQMGIPANVDPRTIKIYGYGGRPLPKLNSLNKHYDLPETAIYFQGENDGALNDEDYLLFYGVGTQKWDTNYASHINPYSNDAYYLVTYGGNQGKRIETMAQPSAPANKVITDSNERIYHEIDAINVANLSRKWFSDSFSNSFTLNYTLNLIQPNLTKKVVLSGNLAAASNIVTTQTIANNNQILGTIDIREKTQENIAYERFFQYTLTNPTATNQIAITFSNNGLPSSKGYVDFVAIDYFKNLIGYGKQYGFRNSEILESNAVVEYQISNAASISQVWNVSDMLNPTRIVNNENLLRFKSNGGILEEFVALDLNDVYTPQYIGTVANQNLKGTIFNQGAVDYLIITREDLIPAAERLANFHKEKNNYTVKVVSTKSIYEEFSSGQQDVSAIRNFIRYVYFNSPNTEKKLKYINLFGETSFDYKNRVEKNNNVVPIFMHLYSLLTGSNSGFNFNDQSSFSTDDFYGLMDDNEGYITSQTYLGIDIAVGRVLANNITEANEQVDKIIKYHNSIHNHPWMLNGIAIADDVDKVQDEVLQKLLDESMNTISEYRPEINIQKILLDSYKQETTSGGVRYPLAKKDIYDAIERGALFVNYLGHGGERVLADERIMEYNDIANITNGDKTPLFIIITCEFTKFDNPLLLSGGEQLLQKKEGGAIALLATSRKIGITSAGEFTKKLPQYMFNSASMPTGQISIADALRQVKNLGLSEKAVVNFLGDPAMKIALAQPKIVLKKINNIDIDNFQQNLKALEMIKIQGEVQTPTGTLMNNFNDDVFIQIFDKEIEKKTLVNDNIGAVFNYKNQGENIFKGTAKTVNGIFELEFMLPKDIKMPIGKGKINMFATKNTNNPLSKIGTNTEVNIGGINTNATEDKKAPELKLYMNTESFVNGGTTDANPLFIALLSDENGLNTASGIGHEMVLILDNDENNPIIVNEYYQTESGNFRKGSIKFPFKNLSAGLHTLKLKVWDSYNNLSIGELNFIVDVQEDIKLENVLNYPNPFIDYTEFWFEHNKINEPLEVQVQIFTITGKIVKTINQSIIPTSSQSRDLKWDGKDDFGNKIGKGTYIYRLKVKSNLTGKQAEKVEKIVIL